MSMATIERTNMQAIGVDESPIRPSTRVGRRETALEITVAILGLGLFGRIMTYPVQHDEQYYVPAGILFSPDTLYNVLGFGHLPNLPILLHLLYQLPIAGHYLLAARLLIVAGWVGLALALVSIGRMLGAGRAAILLSILLLITNPILLGPTGMAATNNLVPMTLAMFGLAAFIRGELRPDGRFSAFALSGLLLSLAGGFKVNYAVLIAPFVVGCLFLPRTVSLPARLAGVLLPFLVGGLIGGAPTLFFLVRDPQGLLYHTIAFHRGPQIAYWLSHGDPADPKFFDLKSKLVLAQQLWSTGVTLVLLFSLGAVALISLSISRLHAADRRAFWPVGLIGSAMLAGVALSFLPTPAFPQYYTPPIPFGLALFLALIGRIPETRGELARPVLSAAAGLALVLGAPMLMPSLPSLLFPRSWTGFQIHDDAGRIAELIGPARLERPVATLAPLYVLEAGDRIYPQLGLGPFIYRAIDYVPPQQQVHFVAPVSPTRVGRVLEATCPAAILVGLEGDLETPLIGFAKAQGYSAHPLMLRAAGKKQVFLLVEHGSPGRPCARAPADRRLVIGGRSAQPQRGGGADA